jgi:hypothetical protein
VCAPAMKCLDVEAAIDRVAAEQGAEEQHLARQEYPHAKADAFALQPKVGPRFVQCAGGLAHDASPCGRARASSPVSSARPKS